MTESAEAFFDPTFRLVDTLILLSLSRQMRHGYEIEAHIYNMGRGRVMAATGGAYKAIARLVKEGTIERLDHEPGDRRRYYAITEEGRRQLGRDIWLMRRVVTAYELLPQNGWV